MSLLLDNNLFARLTQTNVLVGLILLVIGVVVACMAGFITKKVRKTKTFDTRDKVYLISKAFALAVIMASLIVMIVE